jgi:cob(I)alamin adenosyltransferase
MPLTSFIIPGGHQAVCIVMLQGLFAEGEVIRPGNIEKVNKTIIKFLNRMSDYLFVLSLKTGAELKIEEFY